MPRVRNRWLSLTVLGLAIIIWSAGFAQAHDGGARGTPGPITLHSYFTYPQDAVGDPFEQVWFAGFSETESEIPTKLGVALVQEQSGWIPVWYLQLHSEQGLLLPTSATQVKTNSATGTQYINLGTLFPERGVTYETMLSYDAATGGLSIWVNNVDTGKVVYRQGFSIAPYSGNLHPVVGVVPSGSEGTVSERFTLAGELDVSDRYIPQATDWGLVEVIDGVPQTLTLHVIDRTHSDYMAIRLDKAGAPTGRFDFYSESDGERVRIMSVPAAGDDGPFIFPVDQLPYGDSRMVMEYVDNDEVVITNAKDIRVGRIEATTAALHYSDDTGRIEGEFLIWADGPIDEAALELEVELFELFWDMLSATYRSVSHGSQKVFDGTLALHREATSLPFTFQLPKELGLWHVQYRFQVEPEIFVGNTVRDQLIGTYPGARRVEGPPEVPLIIAHRGASGVAPENTIPAIEEAIRIGADLIEIDVHRTRDDALVVIHDGSVDRTTRGNFTGYVPGLTLEQIKTLDAGIWKSEEYAGTRVPTVEEALAAIEGKSILLIEGKASGIERDLADLIRSMEMEDQVVYQSFNTRSVRMFRQAMPEVPAGVLFGNLGIEDDFERAVTVLTQALYADASVVGMAYTGGVTRNFVRYVQQGGMDVWTWTVNSAHDMQRMISAGVDGIITDYPETLVEIVRNTD